MTKYNSSEYRAVPLASAMEKDPSKFYALAEIMRIDGLSDPYKYKYGAHEMRLKPPKKHLTALIEYLSKKDHKGRKFENGKRRDLFCGTAETRETVKKEAIAALEKNYGSTERAWYIFEGCTCPDIYIEGDGYVIVCECKWTEPHITTDTAFLRKADGEYRNQMVRHIQGALGSTDKRVIAFYIADEGCGYENDLKKAAMKAQLDSETIKLDDEEKEEILSCFCGYTTWQEIEKKLGIKFKTLADVDRQRGTKL